MAILTLEPVCGALNISSILWMQKLKLKEDDFPCWFTESAYVKVGMKIQVSLASGQVVVPVG